MSHLPPDPVIDEIREIRHEISAQFDHDPKRLYEHFLQVQEEYKDRLFTEPEPTETALS